MERYIGLTALVVESYQDAIEFYVETLGFELRADEPRPEQDKRWVVVAPKGSQSGLLLARAADDHQISRIGDQTGGRVFLFLYTDDFWRDYHVFREKGVEFVRPPAKAEYGTVAVFKDLYGNRWDLIGPSR